MGRTVVIGLGVILAMLVAVLATDGWGPGRDAQGASRWPMLLEDLSDRAAYQLRGRWLPSGGVPYIEEYSEYPQLTTWAMALPYLAIDHGVQPGEPFGSEARLRALLGAAELPASAVERCLDELGKRPFSSEALERTGSPVEQWAGRLLTMAPGLERVALTDALTDVWRARSAWKDETARNRKPYGDAHQVLMGLLLIALLFVSMRNLAGLGASPAWALLLLLPGGLFYAFSRFDLLVTLLVALALGAHLRRRPWWAALLLGLAIMAKWYPVVLVPLFLSHDLHTARDEARRAGRELPWSVALRRHVLLPGLVVTAVVAAILSVTWLWGGGGLAAVRFLFDYHSQVRVPNVSSLLSALSRPDLLGWVDEASVPRLKTVFTVLQLAPGFALACLPLRSRDGFLLACLTATLGSIVFSKFFSPQWVAWGTAVALLLAARWRVVLVGAVVVEALAYLQLPVFHYHAQTTGEFEGFLLVNGVRLSALLVFFALSLVLTVREALRPRTPSTHLASPAHPRS